MSLVLFNFGIRRRLRLSARCATIRDDTASRHASASCFSNGRYACSFASFDERCSAMPWSSPLSHRNCSRQLPESSACARLGLRYLTRRTNLHPVSCSSIWPSTILRPCTARLASGSVHRSYHSAAEGGRIFPRYFTSLGFDESRPSSFIWWSCKIWVSSLLAFASYAYFQYVKQDEYRFFEHGMYRFTAWFGSSSYAPAIMLSGVTANIIVFSAYAYAGIAKTGLSHGMWKAWSLIVSPDGGAGEKTSKIRAISALTSIGGIIVFAMLISMVTQQFAEGMEALKNSQCPIVESGHTVLVGWNDKSLGLVRELCMGFESEGGSCIAVLDPRPLDKLKVAISKELGDMDMLGTYIVPRSGDAFIEADLKRVAVEQSRSVIISSDPSVPKAERDAVALQKLVTIVMKGWPDNGNIVVHVSDSANAKLVNTMAPGKVYAVDLSSFTTEQLMQCLRYQGLSHVLADTLSHEGAEIYMQEFEKLEGRTFLEVMLSCRDAVPFGVRTATGQCILCPSPDYVVQKGDKVLVYAEDDDTYGFEDTCIVNPDEWSKKEIKSDRFKKAKSAHNTLIVGWNPEIQLVLSELSKHCARGSTCTILSDRKFNLDVKFPNIKVNYIVGSPVVRANLEKLPLDTFDNIVFLADAESWGVGPRWERPARIAADGRTVAAHVLLEDIIASHGIKKKHKLVAEVLDADTHMVVDRLGLTGFVNRNRSTSQVLALASENPLMLGVLDLLLSSGGHSFHLVSLKNYLPLGAAVPESVSFWDLSRIVRSSSNDVLVGWMNKPSDHVLNPAKKEEKIEWTDEKRLIVIGDHH